MTTDLFGNEVVEPVSNPPSKRKTTPAKGYAERPGTGPTGETCKTCRYKYANEMRSGRVFWKCCLMVHCWTSGRGSDILVNSPACKRWQAPE